MEVILTLFVCLLYLLASLNVLFLSVKKSFTFYFASVSVYGLTTIPMMIYLFRAIDTCK